jgi:hypothetical protein
MQDHVNFSGNLEVVALHSVLWKFVRNNVSQCRDFRGALLSQLRMRYESPSKVKATTRDGPCSTYEPQISSTTGRTHKTVKLRRQPFPAYDKDEDVMGLILHLWIMIAMTPKKSYTDRTRTFPTEERDGSAWEQWRLEKAAESASD